MINVSNFLDVSVIVPLYNCNKYILPCLQSIFSQSARPLEIIAVDDQSDDGGYEVLTQISEQNGEFLRVFRQEKRLGAGAARNLGLSLARGKYVMFVDADDMLAGDYLERLQGAASPGVEMDVIHSAATLLTNNQNKNVFSGEENTFLLSNPVNIKENAYYNNADFRIQAYLQGEINKTAVGNLYSREFLARNKITFPENMTYGENVIFTFHTILKAKNYALSPQLGYVARQTRDSGLRESGKEAANSCIDSSVIGAEILKNIMREIPAFSDNPLNQQAVLQFFYANMPTAPLALLKSETEKLTPQRELEYLVLNICDHCNLNCKGCDHFASIAKERFVSLENIQKDLKRFSKIMGGRVQRIGVMGGEPLLHPELTKILKSVRENFPNTRIQLDTNGILLLNQKEEFFETCRKYDIVIVNTKYPIKLDFEKMRATCAEKRVKFEFYGDTGEVLKTSHKIVMDVTGMQDAKKSFSRCSHANSCNLLMEGKLYPCPIAPNAHIFNEYFNEKLELSEGDYLNIYEENLTEEKVLQFLATPMPFCRYCNISERSFGHPWSTSKRVETEWTLSEREKHPEEFERIYQGGYKLRYEVHLTEHCNLNCRGCFHFSAVAEEEYLSVEEYERDCGRLAALARGQAEEIKLLGGEPLLHKRVTDFFEITRRNFPDASVILVTNAILLPKMDKDFWLSCQKYNIRIMPTKYPINVDYAKCEELARSYGVSYGYFDGGTVTKTLTLLPLDLSGKQDKEDNFVGCHRSNACITLRHGKLYTCIIPAHIHHFEKKFKTGLPDFKEDGIDIYQANSVEEIMEFLSRPIEACRYCDRRHVVDGMEWGVTKKQKEEWLWQGKESVKYK